MLFSMIILDYNGTLLKSRGTYLPSIYIFPKALQASTFTICFSAS